MCLFILVPAALAQDACYTCDPNGCLYVPPDWYAGMTHPEDLWTQCRSWSYSWYSYCSLSGTWCGNQTSSADPARDYTVKAQKLELFLDSYPGVTVHDHSCPN